jgi:hypothetical protein
MIELKNSKTQYLGKASGRDRYALDAFIGAVQMSEPGGPWQDIKPCLVRNGDGWHVETTPYYAEIKDDGSRLFCPDRNERSKYLRLPAPSLFSDLSRDIRQNPDKLGGSFLPNQITMPTEWGEYRIIFTNTGMHFEILFTKAPPSALFGKDSPRIVLDAETAGIDIEQMLRSREATGIPRPRLMAANREVLESETQDRWLDWSLKGGQLELGFDFGDLPFPILLKNTTIDVQVGAGADDGYRASGAYGFQPASSNGYCGYSSNSNFYYLHNFQRFTGVTLEATIDVAYLQCYQYGSIAGSPELKVYGVDEDNPAAPTSAAEFDADPLTSAAVDWDGLWTINNWNNSPSLVSIVQELVDSYTISGDAIMFQTKNDKAPYNDYNNARSYNSDPAYAVKLHIEYTAGGTTAKTSAENGAGAEGSALQGVMYRGETAGGTDIRQSLFASLVKNEVGTGVEQSLCTSFSAKLSSETGSGNDTAGLIAGLSTIESGLGVDVGWLVGLKSISSGDGGNGNDALKAVIGTSGAVADMKLPGRQGQVTIPSKGVSL